MLQYMYWWQRLIMIVLLVVTSVLIALPANSLMLTDYGRPTAVNWEGNPPKAVILFSKSDLFTSYLWLLVPLVILLGFAFISLIDEWCCRQNLSDEDMWFTFLVAFQVVLIGCSIGVTAANRYYYDVPVRLAEVIKDQGLLKEAQKFYHQNQLATVLLTFASFVIADVAIMLISFVFYFCCENVSKAYGEYKKDLLASMQGGNSMISLKPDGSFEQTRYVYRLRLWPFPAVVPARQVVGSISWQHACTVLAQTTSPESMEILCRNFKISLTELFGAVATKTSDRIVELVHSNAGNNLSAHINKAVGRGCAKNHEKAKQLLQRVSDTTLKFFQQELVASVREAVESQLEEFQRLALLSLRQRPVSNASCTQYNNGAFPDGTKFYLQSGQKTVFVIEEKPQVRTVTFSRGFRYNPDGTERLEEDTCFRLAFPYTIFLVELISGRFLHLFVFFSKSPLKSLADIVLCPPLPNLQGDSSVCLRFPDSDNVTIADEVRAVISHFWQSSFNNDLRSHYDRTNNPVRDVWDWQKKTIESSAFATTADWRTCDYSLEQLVNSCLRGDRIDEAALAEREAHKALKRAVGNMVNVVENAFIGASVENRYTKTIQQELAKCLVALGVAAVDCGVSQLNGAVQNITADDVRHQYNLHLQCAVNEAMAQTFVKDVVSTLLNNRPLLEQLCGAIDERRM